MEELSSVDFQTSAVKGFFPKKPRAFRPNKIAIFISMLAVLLVAVCVVLLVLIRKAEHVKNQRLPGSCLILEEKYCREVKLIDDPWLEDGLLAAYKIPQGVALFSPVEGSYSDTPTFYFKKEDGSLVQYPGAAITVEEDRESEKTATIYGFVYFKKEGEGGIPSGLTGKGKLLGLVSDKKIDFLGDYNLIFSVIKQRLQNGKYVSESENQELKRILDIQ